jgi:hypothetical protein
MAIIDKTEKINVNKRNNPAIVYTGISNGKFGLKLFIDLPMVSNTKNIIGNIKAIKC